VKCTLVENQTIRDCGAIEKHCEYTQWLASNEACEFLVSMVRRGKLWMGTSGAASLRLGLHLGIGPYKKKKKKKKKKNFEYRTALRIFLSYLCDFHESRQIN
jgi:hypothetical protein